MTPHGPWTILSGREVYRDPFVALRRDEVLKPDGSPGSHVVVQIKSGVSVVALDDAGNVWLTREFHYAVGAYGLEVVSGGVDPGESPREAAEREVQEELGVRAAQWTDLGVCDPFTTIVASPVNLYLAEGLTAAEQHLEGSETISIVRVPLDEAVQMALDGRITQAPSVIALMKTAWLKRGYGGWK